jgi:hypothetical protein
MMTHYNDDSLLDRERLSYLKGVWVGLLKPVYNSAETGIGTSYNKPSAYNIVRQWLVNWGVLP